VDDWLTYCRLLGENAEKLCFLHDDLNTFASGLIQVVRA